MVAPEKILHELYHEKWREMRRYAPMGVPSVTITYSCIKCGKTVQESIDMHWVDESEMEDFQCTIPIILNHWINIYPVCSDCECSLRNLAERLAHMKQSKE